jgi:hypothetical protein
MKNYFKEHKRFLVQVAILCLLIIVVLAAGSNTRNTYSEPVSHTDSILEKIAIENRLILSDTSLLSTYSIPIFDLPEIEIRYRPTILIRSVASTTKAQLISFLITNNPKLDLNFVQHIVETYISDCAVEGINHDIAISQMCLETGFLRFNGSVKADQFNFCGLGATGKSMGSTFGNMEDGVRAHIQHLKAYASHEPITTKLVDTRFAFVKRGIAPDIHSLAGTWASDQNYGYKMEAMIRLLTKSVRKTETLANGV